MKVRELIEHLKAYNQDLEVAYRIHSEQCRLDADDILVDEKCLPRPDGWIQDKRPDMPTQFYVLFPG